MSRTFDVVERPYFRPVADGWVFRAPNPWMFGEAPHYLVSDEQKAGIMQIAAGHRPLRFGLLLGVVMTVWVVLVVLALQALGVDPDPERASRGALAVFSGLVIAPVLAMMPLWAAYQRFRLRTVLAHAEPTTIRISTSEIRQALGDRMSPGDNRKIAVMWMIVAGLNVVALAIDASWRPLTLKLSTVLCTFQVVLALLLAAIYLRRAARKGAA